MEKGEEKDLVDCLPAFIHKRKVQTFDDLVIFCVRLAFGKTDYASVLSISQHGDGFVDLFPAILAEHFEVGLVNKLTQVYVTTMFS